MSSVWEARKCYLHTPEVFRNSEVERSVFEPYEAQYQ
jgi:hypothetical protein